MVAGGLVGFLKKGSVPSLAAGAVSGGLLALGVRQQTRDAKDVKLIVGESRRNGRDESGRPLMRCAALRRECLAAVGDGSTSSSLEEGDASRTRVGACSVALGPLR